MWEFVVKTIDLGDDVCIVRAEAVELHWLFKKNPLETGRWTENIPKEER